jgi:hypothetical protein
MDGYYPIETDLSTLKHSVRKQARPEGSIAEAYVYNEALTICSRYFMIDDVATRFNQVGMNRKNLDLLGNIRTSCFHHIVEVLGAMTSYWLLSKYDKLVWYVLNNCDEVMPFSMYVVSHHAMTELQLFHANFEMFLF